MNTWTNAMAYEPHDTLKVVYKPGDLVVAYSHAYKGRRMIRCESYLYPTQGFTISNGTQGIVRAADSSLVIVEWLDIDNIDDPLGIVSKMDIKHYIGDNV